MASRTVASKVFAVLDAFSDGSPTLRLTEIAARCELPLPTALRVIRELVGWGGLERGADGSYRIGRRMWTLGSTAPCTRRVRDVALPVLRMLATRTGLDAYVAVLDDGDVLVLDLVPGQGVADRWRPGDRLPSHATAAGKLLLSRHPDALAEQVRTDLARLTPYTIVAPGRLAAELGGIRDSGFAFEREEHRLGRIAAAMLLEVESGAAAVFVTAASNVPLSRLETAIRAARTASPAA